MPYLILIFAVIAETIGTTALQASQQFTRPWPSLVVILAYGISFAALAWVLKFMPVGIAYALWSGMGILFIATIGLILFGQKLDMAAIIGLGLIVAGIAIINLFSNTSTH